MFKPRDALRILIASVFALLMAPEIVAQGQGTQATPGWSQNTHWTYTDYTAAAGVAGQFVFDLEFDDAGHLWIASAGGLLRFDGIHWNRYGQEDGLPSDFVRTVATSPEGRLFIGTNRGLAVLENGEFRSFEAQPTAQNIRRLRFAPSGELWICSDSWLMPEEPGGLTVIDGSQATEVPVPESYVSDVRFFGGEQYLLTASGAFHRASDSWLPLGNSADLGYARDLIETADGQILLNTDKGTYRLQGSRFLRADQGLAQSAFVLFLQDGDSVIALDRASGSVKAWTGRSWRIVRDADFQFRIFEEATVGPDGAFWLAALGSVLRYGPPRSWIRHDDVTGTAYEDDAGRLWVSGDGVHLFSEGDWLQILSEPYVVAGGNEEITWFWSESAVARYSDGQGVDVWSAEELGLSRGVLKFEANSGGLGAAFGPDGLVHFRDGAWSELDDLPEFAPSGMALDDQGAIWLAARVGPTQPVQVLRLLDGRRERSQAPAITSLTPPRILATETSIFLLGDLGMARYTDGTWEEVHDLPSRSVLGWDESGETGWLGHHGSYGEKAGLSMITPDSTFFYPLAPIRLVGDGAYSDGPNLVFIDTTRTGVALRLRNPSSMLNWAVRQHNGDYWASGDDGLFHLPYLADPPETILIPDATSVVAGERLSVGLESLVPWGAGRGGPHQVSWRMEGGEWSLFEPRESLQLPTNGLSIGRHTVSVRARSPFGVVDPSPAQLTFSVVPPALIDQPWFWPILLGLLALTSVGFILAVSSRRQLAELNLVLEDRVQRRTAALEETRTRLDAIVQGSPAPILVLTGADTIELSNPAASALLGRTSEALSGKPLNSFVDPASNHQIRAILDSARSREMVSDRLVSARFSNGGAADLSISAVALSPQDDPGRVLLLTVDITDRIRAERQLRQLSLELQRVQETERRRLSQDLHDDVGGSLTTLKLALSMDLDSDGPVADEDRAQRIDMVQELMDRIRSVSLLLRPSALDDFGLSAAVRTLVDQVKPVTPTRVLLNLELPRDLDIDPDVETAAYRIVQESLTNVVRHAGADYVNIHVWQAGGTLQLEVEDNGTGFDESRLPSGTYSSGLSGMRHRADVLGGSLEITSSGSGTRISAALPLLGPQIRGSTEIEHDLGVRAV